MTLGKYLSNILKSVVTLIQTRTLVLIWGVFGWTEIIFNGNWFSMKTILKRELSQF